MDLTEAAEDSDSAADELAAIAAPALDPDGNGRGHSPLENPSVEPITEEILIAPHPDEPGVREDGSAYPPENPFPYRRRRPGSGEAEKPLLGPDPEEAVGEDPTAR
jgi:hypothetical protein